MGAVRSDLAQSTCVAAQNSRTPPRHRRLLRSPPRRSPPRGRPPGGCPFGGPEADVVHRPGDAGQSAQDAGTDGSHGGARAKAADEAGGSGAEGCAADASNPIAGLRQTSVGVPHTLAEALAATYSNQPVLLAERAKLRRLTRTCLPRCPAGGPRCNFPVPAVTAAGVSRAYSFANGRTLASPSDPPDRHGRGAGAADAVQWRQDAGEHQSRQEPGDGRARDADRAGNRPASRRR